MTLTCFADILRMKMMMMMRKSDACWNLGSPLMYAAEVRVQKITSPPITKQAAMAYFITHVLDLHTRYCGIGSRNSSKIL